MNYLNHYSKLIERAKQRDLAGYSERHHIVPRCMGGSNKKENIVRLTAPEHYVAHQLLVKIYPGNKSLVKACVILTGSNERLIRNNKMFGWIREQYAKVRSLEMKGNTLGLANKGKKRSDETKLLIKEKRTTQTMKPRSEETKEKIRLARLGTKRSAETKEKQRIKKNEFWSSERGMILAQEVSKQQTVRNIARWAKVKENKETI